MEPYLSVYGHVSIDQIVSVAEFPPCNTSVDVLGKCTRLGGTGANISVVAAALGVPTAICAFVGGDFPPTFEDAMRSAGLIMDEFVKVEGTDTSQAIVVNDSGMDQKVLFYQGPQGSASSLGRELSRNAERSSFVHFCTGEPRYYIDIMRKLGGRARKAVDPAQEIHRVWTPELLREALDSSDALFCNKYEARSVLRYLGADSLSQIDKPLVVCTRGAEGSDAYIDGELHRIPAVRAARVEDVTGAGDAFRGGFYAGMYRGYSVADSLLLASAAASFIVEAVGALSNIPTWDEVLERADPLLGKVRR